MELFLSVHHSCVGCNITLEALIETLFINEASSKAAKYVSMYLNLDDDLG